MKKIDEIKQHLEKINKLEQTLVVFEESDELYLDVLHKIQGEFDEISDLALNAFRELTEKIRNVGSKTINNKIKTLPNTVQKSVKENMDELINELK
ncbi:hypothetical protein CHCC14809_2311 [Bacillus licheniformis]|uniref:Uncharacterized protein n=1 Tax=Bacillus paralicheniformis TaxID=1648923 RepID=A0ABY3FZE1_9BACI|nr:MULTISPECIES: hypothetical protein [Bacillus subtilis group]KND05554.1 hypothetical protein ACJ43_20565 [Bacillus paralicheniformis]MBM6849721.1 hypothetical protein [Bacillus licheniformis]MED1237897.1 hypothetical protein [Bacillus paralicheniformis]OJT64875.1 hypothetical protein BFP49_06280 [Bacillus licheniformis]TWL41691.1 hypothetical protein CHCC15381_3860 [Bacillus paralicheniformis]